MPAERGTVRSNVGLVVAISCTVWISEIVKSGGKKGLILLSPGES
jgi:hypothetical protein